MPASLIILIAMTVVVASLALYRRILVRSEGDTMHIGDPTGQLTTGQRDIAHTLKQIDRLGIGLTAATVLYGLALFAVFLYKGLMDGSLG
jgi:asparagine N-glycosylation enzyme membrane subunit Stt3